MVEIYRSAVTVISSSPVSEAGEAVSAAADSAAQARPPPAADSRQRARTQYPRTALALVDRMFIPFLACRRSSKERTRAALRVKFLFAAQPPSAALQKSLGAGRTLGAAARRARLVRCAVAARIAQY